ncbi:MAG: hypothetical protein IOC96_12995 [Rhodobacter sp.]|nr:hypothetical protein [Rhodobacter sp.]
MSVAAAFLPVIPISVKLHRPSMQSWAVNPRNAASCTTHRAVIAMTLRPSPLLRQSAIVVSPRDAETIGP